MASGLRRPLKPPSSLVCRICLHLLLTLPTLLAQPETIRPGAFAGGYLLPTGWITRPAGRQVDLSTLPTNSVLTPDGKFLIVLHTGYLPPALHVLSTETWQTVNVFPLTDAGNGLALTTNGRLLYVSGGSTASISEIAVSPEGRLSRSRSFETIPSRERTHQDFFGDIALTPDNRLLFVADLFRDRVLVINPQSGRVIDRFSCRRRPYRILFHPDGKSYFVTSWTDGVLQQFQTEDGYNMGTLRLGPHTTDMVWRDKRTAVEEGQEFPFQARIFVTASNTNRVYSVGITATKEMRLLESLNLAMTPRQPLGMTPSALALSPNQDRLYVVCSDVNAVAVAEVSGPQAAGLGYVPTGWYPTSARVLSDGRLIVLNGKGQRSAPASPDPVLARQRGSASIIDPFDDAVLEGYTKIVLQNTPYSDRALDQLELPSGHPLQPGPGVRSPIEHVIYILKSGQTNLESAPNHRKFAREFLSFNNFYTNGDTRADGHFWSIAAIVPSYIQRMSPAFFADTGRRHHYDFEGIEPTAVPPTGYLWTQVMASGLSLRNYGFFVENVPLAKVAAGGNHVASVRDAALAPVTNLRFRGFDPEYPDADRAKVFLADLAQFNSGGNLPRLLMLRMSGDGPSGDLALGSIVEALSRSRYWPKMAVFLLQESGHGPAFVLSPYTRRGGTVDSTFYNTTSLLRTIELVLGLRPMTLFDAASPPMSTAFSVTPDPSPFYAAKP